MAIVMDRAIHIKTHDDLETDIHLQPLAVSRILANIVHKESPNLVLIGKQSIDDDSNQVAQRLHSMTISMEQQDINFARDWNRQTRDKTGRSIARSRWRSTMTICGFACCDFSGSKIERTTFCNITEYNESENKEYR
eukprot:11947_1